MKRLALCIVLTLVFSCRKPTPELPKPVTKCPAGDEGMDCRNEKLGTEGLGEIVEGLGAEEVIKKIGKPESKDDLLEEGATGALVQNWTYTKKGLYLTMEGDEKNQSLRNISAAAPCDLKTKRGVGIGSTYEEVKKLYEDTIDAEFVSPEQIVAGSLYHGVFFAFKEGKVETIFIGIGAE